MALDGPIAAYNAATNLEAQLILNILTAAGIEAAVVADMSPAGFWSFGVLPQIHRPQVWINRPDMDRAKPILEDYMRRADERRTADAAAPPIEVVCEECGKSSSFPGNQNGTVQDCPHCGAFVDVGDEVAFDEWDERAAGGDEGDRERE